MPDAARLPGRAIVLERVQMERHAADLWRAIGSDAALWEMVPPGPFADEAAFREWLQQRATRPDQVLYALVENGTAVGLYLLINIDDAMGRIEMGLMYGPRLSRKTAGTEGFLLLARYVFETLGYRRFEWRCHPENAASMRAARRFGFTFEGVLRQSAWIKDRNWDTAVFSIIDGEWPQRKARLEAWLAPENFTPDGRQKRALADMD